MRRLGRTIFTGVCLLPVAVSPAFAELSLSGYAKTSAYWFTVSGRTHEAGEFSRLGVRLQVNGDASYNQVRAKFAVDIDYDFGMLSKDVLFINPFEIYVDLYTTLVDLRVGKQFVFWGTTSWLPPTDVLAPWNFAGMGPEIEDYRVSVPAVKLDFYLGDVTVEGICFYSAAGNRYGPGLTAVQVEPEAKALEGALKVMWPVKTVDFSAGVLLIHDKDGLPVFSPEGMGFDYTRRVAAFTTDGVWVSGRWSLRWELLAQVMEQDKWFGRNNPYRVDAAVEAAWMLTENSKLSLQYRFWKNWNEASPAFVFPEHRLVFTGDVRLFSDMLRIRTTVDAGVDKYSLFVMPILEFRPVDAISFSAGTVVFDGDRATVFGAIDAFDTAFVEVKGYF